MRRDPLELTEIRSTNHESCHSTARVLLGLPVDVVTIDRHQLLDAHGATIAATDGSRAADEAVAALAAVLVEPGRPGESDADVTRAVAYAKSAGVPWRTVSQRAVDLVSSPAFRRGYHALATELFDRRTIVGPEIRAIVLAAAEPEDPDQQPGTPPGAGRALTAGGVPAAPYGAPPPADRPTRRGGSPTRTNVA